MTCPWHAYLSFSFWYTLERTHDKIYPIFCLLKKSSKYSIDSMNFKKKLHLKKLRKSYGSYFWQKYFFCTWYCGKMKDNILIKIRQKLHQIKKTQKFNWLVYIFFGKNVKLWCFLINLMMLSIEFLSNFERNIIVYFLNSMTLQK